MAEQFKIQGLDDVLRKMRGLSPALKKKGLRSAGTKAMRPVRDEARSAAKEWDDPKTTTKPIWKRIVTRYNGKDSKRIGGVVTQVGVEGGARVTSEPDNAGHWRHQEMGTSKTPARPALRPALANNIQQVTDIYATSINSDIDKIIGKGR